MTETTDWLSVVRSLGPGLAAKAAEHDAADAFVADNYATLKQHGFFSAGVPAELGGGGASHAELCAMIRELARHCSSTALAASMHTHIVAALAYAWRSGNATTEPMLRRVAAEKLVLVSTGGADWLQGSGTLVKVDGGFRLTGRKIFCSGVPGGQLLMTSGIYDDPKDGPTVIHFPLAINAEGVTVLDTWRTLGMRGTGSHDVQLENVFLPDAAMGGLHRTPGKWHPFLHLVAMAALPVIYSAYLGVAESARDVALALAKRKKDDPHTAYLVGEMETCLISAQLAVESMIDIVRSAKPGPETTAATLARRTLAAAGCIRTVEKALDAAGGAAYYRSAHLERLFRDVQAARYHPMPEKPQARFTGRVLLGLDIDG